MSKVGDPRESVAAALRRIPKIDRLVAHEALAGVRQRLGAPVVTRLARDVVRRVRDEVRSGEGAPELDVVAARVRAAAEAALRRRVGVVINGSGVVVHTNLGRAPLAPAAVRQLADTAGRYVSLELDVETGRRGPRGGFAEMALCQLTGAEDALVVNNNAAAVLLVLTALAKGRGVLVSRGEQVEIGGGFRIPDVLMRSGARMIEVGTTNRTRIADYARVLDEPNDVALLLRIHPGNFRQTGFVERPHLRELAELAHRHGIWLVKDLGGGALDDLAPFGLPGEPVARQCVEAGADLTCFSCDKVLGGPQGGAVVGRAELVGRARRDPLHRAVRIGRLPAIALEATLAEYLAGAVEAVPVQQMLRMPPAAVRERVERWCARLAERGIEGHPKEVEAAAGGGALADRPLPSVALVLPADDPEALARRLRLGAVCVLARIRDGELLIDGRTVRPDEDELLLDAVVAACASPGRGGGSTKGLV